VTGPFVPNVRTYTHRARLNESGQCEPGSLRVKVC